MLDPGVGSAIVLLQPAPSDPWQLQEAWVSADGLNVRATVDVASITDNLRESSTGPMTDEPDRAGSTSGNSGSRVFGIVMVVGALFFGLAVGYRLGAQDPRSIAVAPTQPPTRTPVATPSPEPMIAQPSFPPPLIEGAAVSEDLRQAYYAGGAGTSVCDISGDVPVCHRRLPVRARDPEVTGVTFDELMTAGPAEDVTYGAAAIVEDIQADLVVADLYTESDFPFPQPLGPVVQDQNGVYYINASGFDTGRNLVVVRSLSFDRGDNVNGATWHANVIAFDVAYPGASPVVRAP